MTSHLCWFRGKSEVMNLYSLLRFDSGYDVNGKVWCLMYSHMSIAPIIRQEYAYAKAISLGRSEPDTAVCVDL